MQDGAAFRHASIIISETSMNKRQFLKGSCTILTSSMLSRYISASEQASTAPRTNWAGNLTFHTDHLYQPKNVAEVQQAVKTSPKLRALGRGHSFNAIADSTHAQISLKQLDSISLDPASHTVTVGAGVSYGQLAPVIDARGFAVHNLGLAPHVSVVGACATATHGSGSKNKNLFFRHLRDRIRRRRRFTSDPLPSQRWRPLPWRCRQSRSHRHRHQSHSRCPTHLSGRTGHL